MATSNGLDHTVAIDAAGNETQYYAGRTYSPRNLLDTVTDSSGEGTPHTISYRYDARGVRIARTETPVATGSATRYFFYTPELQRIAMTVDDADNVWSQRHASISSTGLAMNHEFGWFAGIPVAELGPARTPDSSAQILRTRAVTASAPATTLYYTFTDHLGTPILQTDTSGDVVWRAEHEPYGNVWMMRAGARTDQPLRLPGQYLAMTWEGTEENYNVFRWYRAGWGRYTQGDPIGLVPTLFGIKNLFGYADANPIDHSDRLGLYSIDKGCSDTCGPDNVTSCYGNPQKINCAKGLVDEVKQRVFFNAPCKKALQAAGKWQQVAGSLMPSAPYPRLTCNKADCTGSEPRYFPATRSIPMCKWFFAYSPPAGAQSMLHEFLHDAGVGDGTAEQTSILTACYPGFAP